LLTFRNLLQNPNHLDLADPNINSNFFQKAILMKWNIFMYCSFYRIIVDCHSPAVKFIQLQLSIKIFPFPFHSPASVFNRLELHIDYAEFYKYHMYFSDAIAFDIW
jgi:hypothetical protein